MNVTKTERKESTKHCCGSGCRRRDSAEHEEEDGAFLGQRITENNVTNADRDVNRLLERIVSPENLNNAYKRVVRNKGAGGVDGMKVDELLQYLKDNGKEIRESVLAGKYKPAPVRRAEIPKDNGKKRIVYCKDDDRRGNHVNTSFDFLGYTFPPRHAKNRYGKFFTNFLPAISEKAKKAIRKKVRGWKLQLKSDKDIYDIANMFNRQIQGWINYYMHFYKSEIYDVLRCINGCLVKWVLRKYKKRRARRKAEHWLGEIAKCDRNLFVHWKFGILPAAG